MAQGLSTRFGKRRRTRSKLGLTDPASTTGGMNVPPRCGESRSAMGEQRESRPSAHASKSGLSNQLGFPAAEKPNVIRTPPSAKDAQRLNGARSADALDDDVDTPCRALSDYTHSARTFCGISHHICESSSRALAAFAAVPAVENHP